MKNLVHDVIAGIGAAKIGGGKGGCVDTLFLYVMLNGLLGTVLDIF